MIKLKPLIFSLLISLGTGAVSGFLTRNAISVYQNLKQPPLSPPPVLFPVVWTVLFFLMGISAYLIYMSKSPKKQAALRLYLLQLAINFVWPLIFFLWHYYLFAFIWLVMLWLLVALMIKKFYKINPVAANLQVPYLVWLTFAAYLNLGVYLLNR